MTIKDKLALPSAEEVAIAQECSREISAYLETGGETQQIDISARDGKKHAISIPTRALSLLADILSRQQIFSMFPGLIWSGFWSRGKSPIIRWGVTGGFAIRI